MLAQVVNPKKKARFVRAFFWINVGRRIVILALGRRAWPYRPA